MATRIDAAVEKLKAQLKQAELRQKQQRARERIEANKRARAQETRRKILLGVLVERAGKTHPEMLPYLLTFGDDLLVRDSDRALFGLPPIAKPAKD